MALIIPTLESITNGSAGLDFQAVMDATDLAAWTATDSLTGVVSGMTVTQHTGSDMNVSIAAGVYMIAGAMFSYAGGTAAIAAADVSDRRDIVTINAAGTVTVTKGTDCGTAGWTRSSGNVVPPVKPSIPSSNVLLGEVGVTSTTTVITTAINVVDKTTPMAVPAGTVLAVAQNAPSTAGSYTLVVSTTGLTALDSTNLKVQGFYPPSGKVKVRLQGFVQGGAAAGTKTVFGVVSTTSSPGTVVGVTGLVNLTPTATAADDGQICTMEQVITGTPGAAFTFYFAAMYSGTATKVIPQGPTSQTTVPTGAPAIIEVIAA